MGVAWLTTQLVVPVNLAALRMCPGQYLSSNPHSLSAQIKIHPELQVHLHLTVCVTIYYISFWSYAVLSCHDLLYLLFILKIEYLFSFSFSVLIVELYLII